MRRFRVASRYFQYDVLVGQGAWRGLARFARGPYSSAFVLTERALWKRWGRALLRASELANASLILVPPGENSKSLKMAERVASQLLRRGADRRSLMVVFGGGVVGDLGGLVASTYMRGIDLVLVPTTVVAQVDSAIGGKNAVNVGAMKNLIGTFYPPRLVAAEPQVLASLSARNFRSGLYEVVKHAMLSGPVFFRRLEAALPSLRPRNTKLLEQVLAEAAQVKVRVVTRDERESRLRMVLNLGHTFGHALEEATAYRRFLHGEAVGWGLLAVIRLGELLGLTHEAEAAKMARLVKRVGPLPSIRNLDASKVLALLARDKKTVGGRIHWVIPERIGRVRIATDIPAATVEAAFRDVQQTDLHA